MAQRAGGSGRYDALGSAAETGSQTEWHVNDASLEWWRP
ncbi:hypothetical protein BURMUCGD2M_3363 [Burkholderia multivorans CGD2M]|uniref:Uncharacterized protein n=1 Tax=Burkholderia multivorans CGD2 TaxID=513052 RepID=B9BW41_9BURK|nr:hypothetical protein BURMUCGD2_3370 [Burkholderia multivorans CGD2]EEE10751.1 hypothetical protein BURMUCGD2M_3363 [Burkholderia multivorans CGD2M]